MLATATARVRGGYNSYYSRAGRWVLTRNKSISSTALPQDDNLQAPVRSYHRENGSVGLFRRFSSSSSGGSGNDPYGVHFDDGENNLGSMPDDEMTSEEREFLNMSEEELSQRFVDEFEKTWTDEKREKLVERVLSRRAEKARVGIENMPADEEWSKKKEKLMKDRAFLRDENNDDEQVKLERTYSSSNELDFLEKDFDEDEFDWMKNAPVGDFPQEDDRLPNFKTMGRRKVNRREAVPLPKETLHHNNLSLLRQYITPGGQIKNRIQTRLGAKDQRKIAKLIKRSRALGLIPHVGQFKVRNNGDIFAPDINEKKDWEIRIENMLEKMDKDALYDSRNNN